jgi:hypothetical protein
MMRIRMAVLAAALMASATGYAQEVDADLTKLRSDIQSLLDLAQRDQLNTLRTTYDKDDDDWDTNFRLAKAQRHSLNECDLENSEKKPEITCFYDAGNPEAEPEQFAHLVQVVESLGVARKMSDRQIKNLQWRAYRMQSGSIVTTTYGSSADNPSVTIRIR